MQPPHDLSELLERARQLAGLRIADLAGNLDQDVPDQLLHAKGWLGQQIEKYLEWYREIIDERA